MIENDKVTAGRAQGRGRMNIAGSLRALAKRNKDGLRLLSAVSGIPIKRLRELAKGAEPTMQEQMMLEALA